MSNGGKKIGFGCLIACGIVLGLFSILAAGLAGLLIGTGAVSIDRGPGVAVLDIRGSLFDERCVLDNLERLCGMPGTKALVVRVDSGGGVATVAEEIYRGLKRAGEDGLPIVASMGSVAASGGYFVCLPAERIFANDSSLTGSIGVLLEDFSAEGLLDKLGIRVETVRSGEHKGALSVMEPMTQEQRDHYQEVIDDFHDIFLQMVREERGLDEAQAAHVADGRVFTGRQAKALGLVDELGDLHDAVEFAAERADIKGEPRIIRLPDEPILPLSLLDFLDLLSASGSARHAAPLPEYRVRPSR